MPKMYEAMRDKFTKDGMPYDKAQAKAAAIYNHFRKTHPSAKKLSNKPETKK